MRSKGANILKVTCRYCSCLLKDHAFCRLPGSEQGGPFLCTLDNSISLYSAYLYTLSVITSLQFSSQLIYSFPPPISSPCCCQRSLSTSLILSVLLSPRRLHGNTQSPSLFSPIDHSLLSALMTPYRMSFYLQNTQCSFMPPSL